MDTKLVGAAVVGAWLVVGCGLAEPERASEPALEWNTAKAAIGHMNGTALNDSATGSLLVSVRYDGARREGMSTPLTEVWLEGSVFHGLLGTEELSGTDFQGMHFTGTLENGTTRMLRVDGITPGTGVNQDIWNYQVSYQNTVDGQWYPLCTNADGSAADAIPLESRWDYRQGIAGGGGKIYDTTAFTFACANAALAKCVQLGYVPWRSVNGVSLEQHHQACTRMVRADFCGDGTSYTADGRWVNLYDSMSIQADTETWNNEAEWDSDGASCFTSQTRATTPISCGERLVTSCGTSFAPKTLLISETPPQP